MTISEAFGNDRFGKSWLWIAPLCILLIYLAFPTRDFYWDGIFFSQIIEDAPEFGASLLHPNHLFYNAVGYLAFQTARFLGVETRAVFVLETVSSIFGALCAGLLYFILKFSRRHSTYLSLTLVSLFAFSAVWWKFSTDAAVYVPSAFFLLVCFCLLQPGQPPRPLLVAVVHSAAMFLHELAVLFFPVAVLGLVLQTVSDARRERVSVISRYAAGAFLLTFGVYYYCFRLASGTFDFAAFVRWILWFAPDDGFNPSVWQSLMATLEGHRKLFFEGRSGFLKANFGTIVLTILLGAAVILLIYKIGRNSREIKEFWRTACKPEFYRRPTVLLCAVWCASYILFLFFFIPRNTFYRLFYFPAVILLGGELLAAYAAVYTPIRRWRLATLVAIVFLSNFIFFIRPLSQVRAQTPLALAVEANRIWTKNTLIYFADDEHISVPSRYVRYFTPTVVWKPLDSVLPAELDERIKAARAAGADVWLDASAIERLSATSDGKIWLSKNSMERAADQLNSPTQKLKFLRVTAETESSDASDND